MIYNDAAEPIAALTIHAQSYCEAAKILWTVFGPLWYASRYDWTRKCCQNMLPRKGFKEIKSNFNR